MLHYIKLQAQGINNNNYYNGRCSLNSFVAENKAYCDVRFQSVFDLVTMELCEFLSFVVIIANEEHEQLSFCLNFGLVVKGDGNFGQKIKRIEFILQWFQKLSSFSDSFGKSLTSDQVLHVQLVKNILRYCY